MRVIDFGPDTDPAAVCNRVASLMSFPEDSNRAFEFSVKHAVFNCAALRASGPADSYSMPATWAKALVAGPSFMELEKQQKIRQRRGLTAGMVLKYAYIHAALGKPPSLNDAIKLVERANMAGEATFNGIKAYPHKPQIHHSWREMRSVAHLYAGLFAVTSDGEIYNEQFEKNLPSVFGLASALLNWAEAPLIAKGKRTFLKPGIAWHLPSHVVPYSLPPVSRDAAPGWLLNAIGVPRNW